MSKFLSTVLDTLLATLLSDRLGESITGTAAKPNPTAEALRSNIMDMVAHKSSIPTGNGVS